MVTQLDSLICVEVPFVKETTKLVSADLELIWSFKGSLQNGKFTEFGHTAETLKSKFLFHLPIFGDLYLPNQAKPILYPLSKVVV